MVLVFLWSGDRRTTAILFALAIFIPFGDGLVILSHLGFAPPIYIHGGTALYMIVVAYFLFRKQPSQLWQKTCFCSRPRADRGFNPAALRRRLSAKGIVLPSAFAHPVGKRLERTREAMEQVQRCTKDIGSGDHAGQSSAVVRVARAIQGSPHLCDTSAA